MIIYGTHCQSILQFLEEVEKFMEEKNQSKPVKYKKEDASSGLGKPINWQHQKDASGFIQCLLCYCTLCRSGSAVCC